jgi:WD40 repeat protein
VRDGRICGGDNLGNIKVWNIFTGVCDMTLSGHTDNILAIVVIDELRIGTCSADNTIKLWNVSSGVCERTLEGHTKTKLIIWYCCLIEDYVVALMTAM